MTYYWPCPSSLLFQAALNLYANYLQMFISRLHLVWSTHLAVLVYLRTWLTLNSWSLPSSIVLYIIKDMTYLYHHLYIPPIIKSWSYLKISLLNVSNIWLLFPIFTTSPLIRTTITLNFGCCVSLLLTTMLRTGKDLLKTYYGQVVF